VQDIIDNKKNVDAKHTNRKAGKRTKKVKTWFEKRKFNYIIGRVLNLEMDKTNWMKTQAHNEYDGPQGKDKLAIDLLTNGN
jgi:hypothetical protein